MKQFNEEEMSQILREMDNHGGSFAKALANLYRTADIRNRNKLTTTFYEYFNKYYNDFVIAKS